MGRKIPEPCELRPKACDISNVSRKRHEGAISYAFSPPSPAAAPAAARVPSPTATPSDAERRVEYFETAQSAVTCLCQICHVRSGGQDSVVDVLGCLSLVNRDLVVCYSYQHLWPVASHFSCQDWEANIQQPKANQVITSCSSCSGSPRTAPFTTRSWSTATTRAGSRRPWAAQGPRAPRCRGAPDLAAPSHLLCAARRPRSQGGG